MDPGGSELDSSLPQPENPCLIVEDSQPDSVALEDDPESSYRALLARRLSSLQPAARSPVLELISSPVGSRCSQTDSQSESSQNNNQPEPGIRASANQSSGFQEESQILNVVPPPNSKRCSEEAEMDSGADSTTHCVQSEEGSSQFGLMELSQSQDLRGEAENSQKETRHNKPAADQKSGSASSQIQDRRAVRSEVSSSSSSEPQSQTGRRLTVQALLHSQVQDQQDSEIPSSQEDLFDAEKTGAAVDSTVADLEQQSQPTPTPAHTLHLLHLSGQGTLVKESLSQRSVDFVAPTPDNFSHTPLIVPSSPTGAQDEHGAVEPMDTSLSPGERTDEKDNEPMETSAAAKPLPSASTPVSQNSPGFVLERPLSVPSQPDFSHDVFVATQSQEAPQTSNKKKQSVPQESSLSLSVSCSLALQTIDDSQATQIEDEEEEEGPAGVDTTDAITSNRHKTTNSNGVSKEPQTAAASTKRLSQPDVGTKTANVADEKEVNSCVMETPSDSAPCSLASDSAPSLSVISQTPLVNVMKTKVNVRGQTPPQKNTNKLNEEDRMEPESAAAPLGGGASSLALVLSQSKMDNSVVMVTDSSRDSQKEPNNSQPIHSASTNGHQTKAPDRLSQTERAGPGAEGLKDKSLDSSGEISFHFTLPKEGELIGPAISATPPLINQLKQTLRHSTPIEINSFSEKPDAAADVSAASDIVAVESGEDSAEKADGKLSLRMKLVTPVEEGSSERFSLQKPTLSEEDGSIVTVTTVAKAVTSSPSVFSRVRQVHRQQDDSQSADNNTPVRAALFVSSPGCNSLPNSQSEPSQQEASSASQETRRDPNSNPDQTKDRPGPEAPESPTQNRTEPGQKVSHQASDSTAPSPSKPRQRPVSHQPGLDAQRSPSVRVQPESPSFRRTAGPAHRRHVRTIQEVRTTITRIITDVYYEDGREVERKVTEESEEPVVDCQVLDSDVSPCRTGSSSMTSGDLADISSLSSKASSLQHSSGGMSSSSAGGGLLRPDFILPPSRGPKAASPRRGGGQQQRGHRGQRAGAAVAKGRGHGALGSRAYVPLSPRGRARRGRPPSRFSSLSRGGGVGSLQRVGGHLQSSSEDERFSSMLPPRLPVSPTDRELPPHSDSFRSSPEEASSAGSSFVGLQVVAKWSSNGYFYSGRIIKDAGEGRFRLRFDDGYECEVAGKDILLCDPIPLETEVTALLEDEYFSTGVVKGHKTEGQELFYSVERGDQRQWYNRTSVILSLDQGNRLREQHSLGPYEPSTPLAKASDISLDNLVEGKRRRRGAPSGPKTPNRTSSSSSSPRSPGPSGKRKLISSEEDRMDRTPAKRGRRGGGNRSAQRLGVCNTSGSGTDAPGPSCDLMETHGPLPPNSSLFMGFAFMLTASSEIDRWTNRLSSDDDGDYVQTGPYNKSYTESQLQAGGGFVLPDFNEEQCKAAYQSLLIADQHCRTRKYLLCVASGVPCVSHMWVRDCCKENKLLNYRNYLLPAGVGPDDGIVEWHPRSSPFKALRVLLVFEKPVELWAQLITLGGGSSVRHFQTEKDGSDVPAGKFDVVVTDCACPPLVEKAVTSQEVPLVSPEWLIQSLICGERLGFHSKPQYRHDFSS